MVPLLYFTDNRDGSETRNAAQQVQFHWKLYVFMHVYLCVGSSKLYIFS